MNSVSTSIAARAPFAVSSSSHDSTLTGGKAMAFVNEIVSEDEVKQLGLDAVVAKFDRKYWRKGRPVGFSHNWTIDRERDIFLMQVKIVETTGATGLATPSRRSVWILVWHGVIIRVELEKLAESSSAFTDSPFRVVWGLFALDSTEIPGIPKQEVLRVLKDALEVYGFWGAHRQLPNTIVEFRF
jgi:hypothetical protein